MRWLAAACALAFVAPGCDQPEDTAAWRIRRLGTPADRVSLARESREILERGARLTIPIDLPEACALEVGFGIVDPEPTVSLRVVGVDDAGDEVVLHARSEHGESRWLDERIAVPSGGLHALRLESDGPVGAAVFSQPLIECPGSASDNELRNVILLSLDTLRADRVGVYGELADLTPNLDRISQSSTLFEFAYSPYPNTLASHATIFTGQYPSQHNVTAGKSSRTIADDQRTLARAFAEQGYRTAAFTENAFVGSAFGFGAGFDRYHDGPPATRQRRFSAGARDTFDRAIDWLNTQNDVPFFLFLHTYEVHNPYAPEAGVVERLWQERDIAYEGEYAAHFGPLSELAFNSGRMKLNSEDLSQITLLYDAETIVLDAEVGRLLENLVRLGILDSTLLILTSDHGEEFAEHGFLGHGETLHQQALRVPLIFHLPGVVPAGKRIAAPMGLIDLGPTIAELAGTGAPFEASPARSLASQIRAGTTAAVRPVFSELLESPRACAHRDLGDFKSCRYDGVAVRDGNFSFIHEGAADRVLLFDQTQDSAEMRDLAAELPEVTARYRDLVTTFREANRRTRNEAEAADVDPETRESLRALGYVE